MNYLKFDISNSFSLLKSSFREKILTLNIIVTYCKCFNTTVVYFKKFKAYQKKNF